MSDNLSYSERINQIRQERDQRVRTNPRNWLALVGLFWLEEGKNTFGSADANKIVIPSLPYPRCGSLLFQNNQVSLTEFLPDLTLNGGDCDNRPLCSDDDETPDLLELGPVSLMVIRRGQHTLLRAWDQNAPVVKAFSGFHYFPIKEVYQIPAEFSPYDPPKSVVIHDMLGGQHDGAILGKLDFYVNGISCSLEVEDAEEEGLISFTDETKKDKTYPGGRFITLAKPIQSQVTLDFNLAVNWPCAYTSFATCPFPPPENHLAVRIEAGEMRYHD